MMVMYYSVVLLIINTQ